MSFLKGGLGSILGTASPALGAITGKGLGAELLPILSPIAGMLMGGKDGEKRPQPSGTPTPTDPPAPPPNGAARGLGRILGADPSRISTIAGRIGEGANQIAEAGGAQGGYTAPQLPSYNNHMQLLNPKILQGILQHFRGKI